ncbi:MAG: tetratricopeptide repeat protein [Planctomycetales bacterium]|nr:tetratricopeptide repeat protein [Planctomycetales bacterium]
MNSSHLRAQVYFRQARYDRAQAELMQALANDPHDAYAHAMLAFCLNAQRKYTEATQEAEQAVHHEPDNPFGHYALASVLEHRNLLDRAVGTIREAIRLAPYDADYASFLAHLLYRKKQWEDALGEANRGLSIDPQHTRCANVKALALVQLGQQQEADATLAHALRESPDDADSHASKGWSLLQQGRHTEAKHHFREALRIDPDMEWARYGMVEALKAKNLVYRIMLKYMFFMNKLASRGQWTVVIGAYLAFRVLRYLSQIYPQWDFLLLPLIGLYVVFAVLTWIAKPLFNLMLRLSRDGRLALSHEERVASNWIGMCILLAILFGLAAAVLSNGALALAAVFSVALLIPVSAIFHCEPGWPRLAMAVFTAVLAACAAAGIQRISAEDESGGMLFVGAFLLGSFLAPLAGNLLVQVLPRRD